MRIKFLFCLLFLNALTFPIFAQSIEIKPKKTVYTRKGKDVPKEKRTFEVTYPVVSGSIAPTAKKKLENTISYWLVFDTTLKENLGDYDWLSALSYTVNYNKNGILDIELTQEGVGAYPDEQTKNFVINLKTGEAVKYSDVFKTVLSSKLANLADKKLSVEKKEILEAINKGNFGEGNEEEKENDRKQINDLRFKVADLKIFSVNDKGATFIYDAGFPHVIQALEPDGRYFFTWTQLKPFIRRDGLLGKFIR